MVKLCGDVRLAPRARTVAGTADARQRERTTSCADYHALAAVGEQKLIPSVTDCRIQNSLMMKLITTFARYALNLLLPFLAVDSAGECGDWYGAYRSLRRARRRSCWARGDLLFCGSSGNA